MIRLPDVFPSSRDLDTLLHSRASLLFTYEIPAAEPLSPSIPENPFCFKHGAVLATGNNCV
jgi:hypothetical protein